MPSRIDFSIISLPINSYHTQFIDSALSQNGRKDGYLPGGACFFNVNIQTDLSWARFVLLAIGYFCVERSSLTAETKRHYYKNIN